jgi:hypothetical protein
VPDCRRRSRIAGRKRLPGDCRAAFSRSRKGRRSVANAPE